MTHPTKIARFKESQVNLKKLGFKGQIFINKFNEFKINIYFSLKVYFSDTKRL